MNQRAESMSASEPIIGINDSQPERAGGEIAPAGFPRTWGQTRGHQRCARTHEKPDRAVQCMRLSGME